MLLTHICLAVTFEKDETGFTCQKDTNHKVTQDKLVKELLEYKEI